MAANGDRAEMEWHVGGQTRTFKFGAEGTRLLENGLGKDCIAYLAGGGGTTNFVVEAVLAGLAYDRRFRKQLTPGDVYKWLDEDKELNQEDFMKEVLYTVARGKSAEEAKRMVKILDEVFREGDVDRDGKGPTSGG